MRSPVGEMWTALAARVLAPNPGPMTLDGTNSYVVRDPGSHQVVIVDPGPHDSVHLARLTRSVEVVLVLLTHGHPDHADLARRVHEATGAPVRALDAELCLGGPPVTDAEIVHAAGTTLRVVATPGHTADSVCFHLPGDRTLDGIPCGSVVTGDTVLGRGTTIIAAPDGSLRSYFASLSRLRSLGAVTALPGHGPRINDLGSAVQAYTAHRVARLKSVAAAVAELTGDRGDHPVSVDAITDRVYPDIDPAVRFAAEANVKAQLDYLAEAAIAGLRPFPTP